MNYVLFCCLMSAVYVSPNLDKGYRLFLSIFFMVLAIGIFVWETL